MPNADAETFRLLSFPYAVDSSQAFCGTIPLKDATIDSFRVLSGDSLADYYVVKDDLEGRFGELPFPRGFGPVVGANGYATDGERIYFGPMITEGIDLETLVFSKDYPATKGKDKHGPVEYGTHDIPFESRIPKERLEEMKREYRKEREENAKKDRETDARRAREKARR